MKLLLTSAGVTNQSIADSLVKLVGKPINDIKIGFIPTAVDVWYGTIYWYLEQFSNLYKYGFKSVFIVDPSANGVDYKLALKDVDVILVGGGNTFHLLNQVRLTGFGEWLKTVLDNKVYMGISAGSILATPMTDKYMGEKLRCMVSKFDLYPQMTNNNDQLKQIEPMLEMYMRKDVANVYYLNLQGEFTKLYKRIYIIDDYKIYSYETQSKILVVHVIQEQENDEYEYLLKQYEEKGISYIVLNKEIMIDIPSMLLLVMEIYRNKNILLMGDIKEYNVDFVNLYEKNEYIDFSCYNYVDKCSDYRILYTKTLYPMYIKNIEMTTIFLLIWSTYNTKQFKNIEHKSLEYCLNKTISVNEMRCQWLYTKTLEKYFPIEYIQKMHTKHYKTPKKVDSLRKKISQCGLKPERNDNGFLRTHFKGSRYVDINYKYENFLFEL
jgi:hypothetical protein